jgi:hypothetical protein
MSINSTELVHFYMIKAETMPATPSKTAQLKLVFMFPAEGLEEVVAEAVLFVLLDVLLPEVPVLDGDVPTTLLLLAAS